MSFINLSDPGYWRPPKFGGGGWALTPTSPISKTIVSMFTTSCMYISPGVSHMSLADILPKFAVFDNHIAISK